MSSSMETGCVWEFATTIRGHYVESFLKRDFYEVVLLPVESFQGFVSGTEMMCMAITGKEN